MNCYPGAILTPIAEIRVYGLPNWKISWQVSPLAALNDDVENGVEHCPHLHLKGDDHQVKLGGIKGSINSNWAWLRLLEYALTSGSPGAVSTYLQLILGEIFYLTIRLFKQPLKLSDRCGCFGSNGIGDRN